MICPDQKLPGWRQSTLRTSGSVILVVKSTNESCLALASVCAVPVVWEGGRETPLGCCEAAGVAEASHSLLHGEKQEGTWAGGGELASCCSGVCG